MTLKVDYAGGDILFGIANHEVQRLARTVHLHPAAFVVKKTQLPELFMKKFTWLRVVPASSAKARNSVSKSLLARSHYLLASRYLVSPYCRQSAVASYLTHFGPTRVKLNQDVNGFRPFGTRPQLRRSLVKWKNGKEHPTKITGSRTADRCD
jgi:hypothetical protein